MESTLAEKSEATGAGPVSNTCGCRARTQARTQFLYFLPCSHASSRSHALCMRSASSPASLSPKGEARRGILPTFLLRLSRTLPVPRAAQLIWTTPDLRHRGTIAAEQTAVRTPPSPEVDWEVDWGDGPGGVGNTPVCGYDPVGRDGSENNNRSAPRRCTPDVEISSYGLVTLQHPKPFTRTLLHRDPPASQTVHSHSTPFFCLLGIL